MTTFESYLSEAPLHKWVYTSSYYKTKYLYMLSYDMGDAIVVSLIVNNNGIKRIELEASHDGMRLFVESIDIAPTTYNTFKQWLQFSMPRLNRIINNSLGYSGEIHIYSLPTEAQYNQLIQPVLST